MFSLANVFNHLRWSHFKYPLTNYNQIKLSGYCYHSVNFSTLGLAHNDHIKWLLCTVYWNKSLCSLFCLKLFIFYFYHPINVITLSMAQGDPNSTFCLLCIEKSHLTLCYCFELFKHFRKCMHFSQSHTQYIDLMLGFVKTKFLNILFYINSSCWIWSSLCSVINLT